MGVVVVSRVVWREAAGTGFEVRGEPVELGADAARHAQLIAAYKEMPWLNTIVDTVSTGRGSRVEGLSAGLERRSALSKDFSLRFGDSKQRASVSRRWSTPARHRGPGHPLLKADLRPERLPDRAPGA
jgi:hypothetical protein